MVWKLKEKNLLNPNEKPKKSYVQKCLDSQEGIIFAASDYIRSHTDQIRPYLNKPFYTLGTDGFGRSDTRKELRKFLKLIKNILLHTL